jgi:septal ring factor EnvC (AmiA/AmiB activator)
MPERVGATAAWAWIVGVVLVIVVVTGYGVVQTQHRLEKVQSELVSAKDEAAQAIARVRESERGADSLKSALDKTNAHRNELQAKLDQATMQAKATQSELKL